MPRGLDAVSDDGPEAEGHRHPGRLPLLQLGGPAQHARASAPTSRSPTGSNSDSLLVLNPQTRQWTTLRVPYPLGFYSRGLDGRIDDPKAAGRAARCAPTTARTSCGTSKADQGGRGATRRIVSLEVRVLGLRGGGGAGVPGCACGLSVSWGPSRGPITWWQPPPAPGGRGPFSCGHRGESCSSAD